MTRFNSPDESNDDLEFDDEDDTGAESASEVDAIEMLIEDHQRVKELFEQFEDDKEDEREGLEDLVAEICIELTIHPQLEEEIFYPAVRRRIEDDELMDEAL